LFCGVCFKRCARFFTRFSHEAAPQKTTRNTQNERKNKTKQRLEEMTDTARPPPMSEIPPLVSASAALKMNSGGGPDDVVAVAALIDELKVRFDYSLIGFFFFPMMVLVF